MLNAVFGRDRFSYERVHAQEKVGEELQLLHVVFVQLSWSESVSWVSDCSM